jgi:hypothetical protein
LFRFGKILLAKIRVLIYNKNIKKQIDGVSMKITNEYKGITCTYHDISQGDISSSLVNISNKFSAYCKLRCKGAGKTWDEKLNFGFSVEDIDTGGVVKSDAQINFNEKKFSISVLKTELKTVDPKDIAAFLFSMWLSNQVLSLKECLYSQIPLCEEDLLEHIVCGVSK